MITLRNFMMLQIFTRYKPAEIRKLAEAEWYRIKSQMPWVWIPAWQLKITDFGQVTKIPRFSVFSSSNKDSIEMHR